MPQKAWIGKMETNLLGAGCGGEGARGGAPWAAFGYGTQRSHRLGCEALRSGHKPPPESQGTKIILPAPAKPPSALRVSRRFTHAA